MPIYSLAIFFSGKLCCFLLASLKSIFGLGLSSRLSVSRPLVSQFPFFLLCLKQKIGFFKTHCVERNQEKTENT